MNRVILLALIGLFSLSLGAEEVAYKVLFAKGEVISIREKIERPVLKGDMLLAGDSIATGPDGILLLSFGVSQASRMKVSSNSKLTLTGTSPIQEAGKTLERTSVFIDIGNIVVNYVNKNKEKDSLEIKTKVAAMGIRGTIFFVHVTPDDGVVVAVQTGVVEARNIKKNSAHALGPKQGVVMSEDNLGEKEESPKWFGLINWELTEEASGASGSFQHSKELNGAIEGKLNQVMAPVKSKLLSEDQKKLADACAAKSDRACSDLGLKLLERDGDSNEVRRLFRQGCEGGDSRACSWIGRVEYEFGSKDKGRSHLDKLCDAKDAYACYSRWEIEKRDGSEELAEELLKRGLAALHGIKDVDAVLQDFAGPCESGEGMACTNLGMLNEGLQRDDKAREFYDLGCKAGDGVGCSNLGYIEQKAGNQEKARELYQKACYLNLAEGCYNLACIHSLKNNGALSLQYFKMAVIGGYQDWEHIASDKDLVNLRKETGYASFIESHQKSAPVKASAP